MKEADRQYSSGSSREQYDIGGPHVRSSRQVESLFKRHTAGLRL